ncbi:glycosyltransferase-like protein [Caballeronia catudaia]|uniref:Glycosyltransferase-like protein n=1 Tax=Caballeronia catudaia TaxID=1777136 RepID=A0A157ZET2_9BURK|nr:glycosyltransferase [Caballeronia catudaia]SAK44026.1 glycosyltransferase-like protein [Caballeronia catudaia]
MKFETLIRDTQWFAAREESTPDVSVLLSLSEGGAQTARRAVESVLAQTLTSIELIVADDSGDAAVAEYLQGVQSLDPRVAVLRHVKRVGIAAVCWNEAFFRARGAFVMLARDEDEFCAEALEGLLHASRENPRQIAFGYVEVVSTDHPAGERNASSAEQRAQSMIMLRVANFIARNAVLIPRQVFDAIGLFDPHVLLSYASDWDFWRRASERFEFRFTDVLVSFSHAGAALGGVLDVDRWAVEEWMRTERNARLTTNRIGEYDVHSPDPSHGRATRDACAAAARAHGHISMDTAAPARDDEGYVLVVSVQYDASAALYFDMLPEALGRRVRVVPNDPRRYLDALARASILVVSRALRAYQPWTDAAKALGIPTYYFLDDNMPLLQEIGEASMNGEDFGRKAFQADLKRFDGVLLSSLPLIDFFRQENFHEHLHYFPVAGRIGDEERARIGQAASKDADEIVLAFMGGLARSKVVWELIIPCLERLTQEGARIHFVAPGLNTDADTLKRLPASLRVTLLPWDPGYAYVVRRFARFKPDFMLLAGNDTPNNPFKTRHPLLTASLIDAVPVLPKLAPYLDIEPDSIALVVEEPFEKDAWESVLRRIVEGRVDSEAIKRRNRQYCDEAFSGEQNADVLRGLISKAGGLPSWQLQYRRLASLPLVQDRIGLGGSRDEHALQRSAEELLALRRGRRYSWRHRILARPSDLWNGCGTAFWPLQQDTLKYGWKRRGGSLEMSDSLHDRPYYTFDVPMPKGEFGGVALAFTVDGLKQGRVSVELIAPSGTVAGRATRDLKRLDLSQPVEFTFDPVTIEEAQTWRLRLRCRSATPVYVYELVNRRWLNMFYGMPSPFMQLLAPRARHAKTANAGGTAAMGAGAATPPVNVKLIIEGDIPTNQIIARVIEEALGDEGSVEPLLLTDFTPDVVLDGGLVVFSRISSPAAIPMIEWMDMHGVSYLYYIDDNFWELTGDTPLAQYYQCEPVRETLRLAIRHSKGVIVNSPLLGEYIKKRHARARVQVLNAPFDFSLVRQVEPRNKAPGEVRIGFAGNVSRAADFVEIIPAFERLLDKYPNVTLVFFGYCPPELVGRERVIDVPTVRDYAEFIALKESYGLDIGLAPMADTASNRYKTNNKYREYGGLRVAGIYTNMSPYKDSVAHGKTGLLIEHDPKAWYDAMELLVTDSRLRTDIANAAYEDVAANYAQHVVASRWRDTLVGFAREYRTFASVEMPSTSTKARLWARKTASRIRLRSLLLVSRARTMLSAPRTDPSAKATDE